LISRHPGVSLGEIRENSEFEILLPEEISVSPEPSSEDLRLLREVIDPTGMAIGK
jgi:hypothetical protein